MAVLLCLRSEDKRPERPVEKRPYTKLRLLAAGESCCSPYHTWPRAQRQNIAGLQRLERHDPAMHQPAGQTIQRLRRP